MKRLALLPAAVLLIGTSVFAQEQSLCELNMQEVEDNLATNRNTLGSPAEQQVDRLVQHAKEAQRAGDTETCIVHTTQALQRLEGPGSSSSSGSAGSGSGSGN